MTDKITVDEDHAAEMLDISVTSFRKHVLPFVPPCNLGAAEKARQMPRWLVEDLRAFAQSRKKSA